MTADNVTPIRKAPERRLSDAIYKQITRIDEAISMLTVADGYATQSGEDLASEELYHVARTCRVTTKILQSVRDTLDAAAVRQYPMAD